MQFPTDDEVRLRAYHLWEINGRQDGRDLDYWIQAALELDDVASGHTTAASLTMPRLATERDGPLDTAMRRLA